MNYFWFKPVTSSLIILGVSSSFFGCSNQPEIKPEESLVHNVPEVIEEVNPKALQHFMDGEMFY